MPRYDTHGPIDVDFEIAMGDVRMTAADRDVTVVEVRPSDPASAEDVRAAEATRVTYGDGHLTVKGPKLRTRIARRGGGSVDVTVELPTGSGVHGTIGAGDVVCDGALGACRLKAGLGDVRLDRVGSLAIRNGAGDVSVDHAEEHADIATASGDVRVRELARSAVIKNGNGDTWVGTGGDLRITAGNGGITVDEPRATVVAKSGNGDVRVGVARGSVVLEAGAGDVEVGIHEGTTAWLDVSAKAGRVHNTLEAAEAPDAAADRVEVRARTGLGDVVIRRAQAVTP